VSTYEHPDSIETRLEQARTLLSAISAGGDGHLVINTFRQFSARSFTVDQIGEAADYAIRKSTTQCVYFGTGLRDRPFNGYERGTSEDISSIACLWADVDWLDVAHKKGGDKLPPDAEAARALIEEFGLKPTFVIASGHGLQAYWALAEPLLIHDDDSRETAKLVMLDFQHAFNGFAYDRHGYVLDSTEDIARVLRVPGTTNRKPDRDPTPVRILEWNDGASYTLDQIPRRATLGAKADTGRGTTPGGGAKQKPRTERVGGATDDQYGLANLDRVMDGCTFMGHVRNDAAALSYPEWHRSAGVVVRCGGGRKHFHELSKPYPGYDKAETDDVLDRARDAGPVKCSTIRKKLGGEPYCSACPFWGGIATPLELGRPHSGKPIDLAFGDLPEQAAKGWAAMFEGNTPPKVYRLAEGMARLDRDAAGALAPVVLKIDHLTAHVARAAPWVRTTKGGILRGAAPPIGVVKDMLVQQSPPLPLLTGVTQVPVFSATGILQQTQGYSPDTGRFYDPRGLVIPAVPASPTPAQIRAALMLVAEELIGDFPFVAASHLAHALAIALLPFGRDFIDGPTPLHLFDKPIQGTGATLLAKVLLSPAVGHSVLIRTLPGNEEECRKALTAALMPMPQALIFDNLSGRIDSANLSSVLTTTTWSDRVLGSSNNISVPVKAAFAATANNVQLSGELARRTVPIRLDAKMDMPWQRKGDFKHSLPLWAIEQRGPLVAALLTLWSAWLAEGRPVGEATLGSYESWAAVMGGLLDVAGISGFLHGLDAMYESADTQGAAEREFVALWWDAHGDRVLPAADLVDKAVEAAIPLGPRDDLQTSALGTLLHTKAGCRYKVDNDDGNTTTEITVIVTKKERSKRNLWQLVRA
jgi:hypothetical protein